MIERRKSGSASGYRPQEEQSDAMFSSAPGGLDALRPEGFFPDLGGRAEKRLRLGEAGLLQENDTEVVLALGHKRAGWPEPFLS